MSDTWWVVLRKMSWESLTYSTNIPVPFTMLPMTDPKEPCGFLPVFATREAAEAFCDDGEHIHEIREASNESA